MESVFLRAVTLLLLSQASVSSSQPVIGPGHETEIEELFSGVGSGGLEGWRTGDIFIPETKIRATLFGPDGERVVVELCHPSGDPSAVANTSKFDFFVRDSSGIEKEELIAFSKSLAESVSDNTRPDFWRDLLRSPFLTFWEWVLTPNGVLTLAWLAALFGFLSLIGVELGRRRPWREEDGRRAMIEMAAVFVLALLVRWVLVGGGPGNFYYRLPNPDDLKAEIPMFGPGQGAWALIWFWIITASDRVAFFAGALCGAAAILPAYLLAWIGTGKRRWGLAASVGLALWPLHARLTPTDSAFGLVTLLLLSSLACIVLADRLRSSSFLLAGWLAGMLAATTRPETALSLLVLGALVLWLPGARRTQLRPVTLLTTAVLGGSCFLVVYQVAEKFTDSWTRDVLTQGLKLLYGAEGSSVLLPPRTPWLLSAYVLGGMVIGILRTRGKAALWVLCGFLPAVPTAWMIGSDFITARYQLPLSAVAAILAGMGAVWMWELLSPRSKYLALLPVVLPAAFAAWQLLAPPPEPTFRLEYAYFREHIGSVPADCKIVRIDWQGDLGLQPPSHLSDLLGLKHDWVEPSAQLPVEEYCYVYWQPASCRAASPDLAGNSPLILEDCSMIESSYRLEPIAQTLLPARRGYFETYHSDPVPVGFFRLRTLPP